MRKRAERVLLVVESSHAEVPGSGQSHLTSTVGDRRRWVWWKGFLIWRTNESKLIFASGTKLFCSCILNKPKQHVQAHTGPTMLRNHSHIISVIIIHVNVKENCISHSPPPHHTHTQKNGAHNDRRAQHCDTKLVCGVCMLSRPLQQHAALPPRPFLPHTDWLWCDWWQWLARPSAGPNWCQRERATLLVLKSYLFLS